MKVLGIAIKLILIAGAGVVACSGGVGDGAGIGDDSDGDGGTGGSSAGTGSGAAGGIIDPGSGGTGATGTGGAGGSAGECPKIDKTAEQLPPYLQLVEDISGSMNESVQGGTKWEVTREALKVAIGQMPQTMSLGISFYPNTPGGGGGGMCIDNQIAVPIAALDANHKAAVNAALDVPTPAGGTPTHDAFDFGVATVQAVTATGAKFVVLITDGAPTYAQGCDGDGRTPVDNGPLIQAAATASAAGVRTFVIGSPGSESARSDLSAMARAGGTARGACSDDGNPAYCHFDMTTQADLGQALIDALNEITGQTVGCAFTIPQPPAGTILNLNKVNVIYLPGGVPPGEVIPRDGTGTSCTSGWQYSADKTQILLCGPTCERVKADPMAVIQIRFGCDTIITAP